MQQFYDLIDEIVKKRKRRKGGVKGKGEVKEQIRLHKQVTFTETI